MQKSMYFMIPIYGIVLLSVLMLTLLTGKTVTAMSEAAAEKQSHVIIIDPGHGGVDGGATSCTGVLESGINLQIALRLDDLMHLLGYQTQMVRTTDISIHTQGETIAAKKISDLKERVKLVNSAHNPILVSIHQNQFADSRYSGAQVFYANTGHSEELAKLMQSNLKATLNPGSNRMAKQASGIYLLEHVQSTGILIECGFLSNPMEEALLRDAVYQKELCCVIAVTIASFVS